MATKQNNTYRTALWTGEHLQITLSEYKSRRRYRIRNTFKSRPILRIEQGQGMAVMGNSKDHLTLRKNVTDDSAIFIPARTWHNVINTGSIPLKLCAT